MAGILNSPRSSFCRPIPCNRELSNRPPSVIRATSNSESPPSSTSTTTAANEDRKLEATFTAPPNFTPPKPQPFAIKSGKFLDVLGASLMANGDFVVDCGKDYNVQEIESLKPRLRKYMPALTKKYSYGNILEL